MYFPTITLLALLPTLFALPYPTQQPRAIAAIGIEPFTQLPSFTSTSIPNVGINAIGRAIGAIAIIEPSSQTASTTGKEVGINAIGRAIGAIAEDPSPTPSTVFTLNAIGRAIAISPTHKPVKPDAIGRAIAAIAIEESPSTTTSGTSGPTFGVEAIGRAIGAIGIIKPSPQPSGVKPQSIGRDLDLNLERRAIGAIGIKPFPQPPGVKVQAIGRDLEGRAIAAIGVIGLASTTTTSARGVQETGVKVDAIGR